MGITPTSNLTTASDEELVNDTNDWHDKLAIRANVEMTRRLKESTNSLNNSIKNLDKTTIKYSKILIGLTIILGVIALVQTILFFLK